MGLQKAVECRPPQAVLGSSSKGSAAGALAQDRFCPPPHQLQIFCNRIVQLHSSPPYYRQAWGGGGGKGARSCIAQG